MGGLAATRRQHALTGLQGHSISSVTVWSPILDYGDWLVKVPANTT